MPFNKCSQISVKGSQLTGVPAMAEDSLAILNNTEIWGNTVVCGGIDLLTIIR